MNKKRVKKHAPRNIFLLFGIISVICILGVSTYVVQTKKTTLHVAASSVSPLIFGTNLTLNDANDQFVTSQATRDALKAMHVQLIRMPIRAVGAPSAWEVQAMQDIKTMGVTPIVVLKYTQTDPAGAAKMVLQTATGIFGTAPIYIEFGNERDLAGVTQSQYTTAWNQVISQVKPLYPHALFGGPVNFQQNPGYIAYFIQNATPAPDFISWHEYTCGNTAAAQTCIDNISHWATHITNTKVAIQATGKAVPPIFITEWNYDPNNPAGDPRATAAFQTTFTNTALQELAKDGVTGSTQYVATGHTEYNLVNPGGQTTAEGQAFSQMYTQLIGGSSQTGTPSPSITLSVTTPPGITSPVTLSSTPVPTVVLPSNAPTTIITPQPTHIPIGSDICSTQSLKACGYTSDCSNVKNGTLCEFQVNGCGKSSSGANIYTCTNRKWVYTKWMKTGACNFCGNGSTQTSAQTVCQKGKGGQLSVFNPTTGKLEDCNDILQHTTAQTQVLNVGSSATSNPQSIFDTISQNIQSFFNNLFGQ